MRRLPVTRESCLVLALFLVLLPSSLHAWGREGHEVIAILAEQRLTPDVREKANRLLNGASLTEVSTWADQVRNDETAPWHYVSIELTETEYDPARVCPQDQCVIGQIEQFQRVLADDKAGGRKRQEALKYLIHFVGDLHQPLHAANRNDRGGTQTEVEFLGQTLDPFRDGPWTLHAVWDSGIVAERDPDALHYAERLNTWLQTQPEHAFEDGSVVDWAMESHRIAKEHAYVLPEDRIVGEEYVRANIPVVDQQLAKAGVRLARLLNEALGEK